MIMPIKYKQYEKFGNILVEDILDKLTGEHPSFERIQQHTPPSNRILIGTLGGVDSESEEDFLNSFSIKFLLEEFNSEMNLDIDFNVYYRVFPTYKEQCDYKKENKNVRFDRIWKRKNINGTLTFDRTIKEINLSNLFSEAIKEISEENEVLRDDPTFKRESVLSSEQTYDKFLESEKNKPFPNLNWDSKIRINVEDYVQNGEKFCIVNIVFINESLFDKEDTIFEPSLFNPTIKLFLNNNVLEEFYYPYTGDSDKYYTSPLRCLNCQGIYDSKENTIKTLNYASFNQKKVAPINDLENIDISFEKLTTEDGLFELEKIYSLMCEFYNNASSDDEGYEDFYLMKERFKNNINLLKEDEKATTAFYLMNETFKRNSENSDYHSWRLFQIVFIVSQIKDIVLDEERDTCELLHVMTGGGKSETYFGIVVFTAFYDRLTGKEFGVSAVTKFPLRMLSVQQLQRISNIFIFAEQVRRDKNIDGHAFSIAYFVGSQDSDFPSHNADFLIKIRNAKNKDEKIPGQIINKCPLCDDGDVYLDIDEEKQLIIHKCEKCGEEFRLYFADDEIYRTLPTFIVSTVDKWASIALNRRIRNLLGGKIDTCVDGHGFIPSKDTCGFWTNNEIECKKPGTPVNISFDTSPTLIIQDEMHLIKEGFGTIDSHFESLIEAMKSEFSGGSKFKNIVMTATVSGADKQIKHLYHKDTRVFPPSLKDENDNTFFFTNLKEDGENIIQRRIVGLRSHIQNFRLIYLILRHVSEFFYDLEKDYEYYARKYEFNLEELKIVSSYYKKLLTYHNKKEAVHSVSYSVDDYVNIYDNLYNVVTEPLTGENSLDDIKNIINKVKNFYNEEDNSDKMFVVDATNIVSHGVDIDEWNLMVFDGMPRSTAEYIQALSRVGRKYFGLVFVSFSPQRTRDLSFYQHFNEYHQNLDDKVETVPLTRWAKLGFKQTFTSIFTASILNYLSNVLNRKLYSAKDVYNVLSKEENKMLLINFIKKAYITDSTMIGSEYFEREIEKQVDIRIEHLEDYPDVKFFPYALEKTNNKYFKTQTGMRGIQDSVRLISHATDENFNIFRGD